LFSPHLIEDPCATAAMFMPWHCELLSGDIWCRCPFCYDYIVGDCDERILTQRLSVNPCKRMRLMIGDGRAMNPLCATSSSCLRCTIPRIILIDASSMREKPDGSEPASTVAELKPMTKERSSIDTCFFLVRHRLMPTCKGHPNLLSLTSSRHPPICHMAIVYE
jgi:hypothetical protein